MSILNDAYSAPWLSVSSCFSLCETINYTENHSDATEFLKCFLMLMPILSLWNAVKPITWRAKRLR